MKSENSSYTPISCGAYDQLELACIRGSKLQLTLAHELFEGTATTIHNNGQAEWLEILDEGGRVLTFRLDMLVDIRIV